MIKELQPAHDKVIRQTEIETDAGRFTVSTVCLDSRDPYTSMMLSMGSLGGYKASGYETMVFQAGDWKIDLYAKSYTTEEESRLGHQKTLDDIASGKIVLRDRNKRKSVYE